MAGTGTALRRGDAAALWLPCGQPDPAAPAHRRDPGLGVHSQVKHVNLAYPLCISPTVHIIQISLKESLLLAYAELDSGPAH